MEGGFVPDLTSADEPALCYGRARLKLCKICDNSGWVCENHPTSRGRPWAGFSERSDACGCGAGDPSPTCNAADADQRPDMSGTRMKIAVDIDRSPNDDLE